MLLQVCWTSVQTVHFQALIHTNFYHILKIDIINLATVIVCSHLQTGGYKNIRTT